MNNSSLNNPSLTTEKIAGDYNKAISVPSSYTVIVPGWILGGFYSSATASSYIYINGLRVGQEYGTEGGFCAFVGVGDKVTISAAVNNVKFIPCKGNLS